MRLMTPSTFASSQSLGGVSLLATTLGRPAITTAATTDSSAAASASLARTNTRDSDHLLNTWIIADAVQEEGGGLGEVVLHGNVILDDSKRDIGFPALDSVQEVAHLGFFAQAMVRRGGGLKVGCPELEACVL